MFLHFPQSINLLNADFISNVAYGLKKMRLEAKVWESLKTAQLSDLIETPRWFKYKDWR